MRKYEAPLVGDNQIDSREGKNILELLRKARKMGTALAFGMVLFAGADAGLSKYGQYKENKHVEMFKNSAALKEGEIDIKISSLTSENDGGRISPENLRAILLRTYPLSWISTVNAIIEAENELDTGGRYGSKLKNVNAVASCNSSLFGTLFSGSDIVFYDSARFYSLQRLLNRTFSHELGHAYRNSLFYSGEALDHKIRDRLQSDDRFISEYVENIDADADKDAKVGEYWAEIVSQFFEDASQLNIKDFKLVANEISKTDPDFNWRRARDERAHMISESIQGENRVARIDGLVISDKVEGGKLIVSIKFQYEGYKYETELEGDADLAGKEGMINYTKNGFIYYRSSGESDRCMSFYFEPEGNSKILLHRTATMEKIKELNGAA